MAQDPDLPKIISDEEFAGLLKQRERVDLPGGLDCWDNTSLQARPKPTDGLPESTLEQRFPRVAEKLTVVWRSQACSEYINSLVVNDRDTRVGFPEDVIEDLIMLHAINELVMRKIGLGLPPKLQTPGYRPKPPKY